MSVCNPNLDCNLLLGWRQLTSKVITTVVSLRLKLWGQLSFAYCHEKCWNHFSHWYALILHFSTKQLWPANMKKLAPNISPDKCRFTWRRWSLPCCCWWCQVAWLTLSLQGPQLVMVACGAASWARFRNRIRITTAIQTNGIGWTGLEACLLRVESAAAWSSRLVVLAAACNTRGGRQRRGGEGRRRRERQRRGKIREEITMKKEEQYLLIHYHNGETTYRAEKSLLRILLLRMLLLRTRTREKKLLVWKMVRFQKLLLPPVRL